MSGRKKIILFLAVVFVGAVVAVVVWPGEREPEYQGRKLSEWLRQGYVRPDFSEDAKNAADAVRQIGTNALPLLIHAVSYERSPFRSKVMSIARRNPIGLWRYQIDEFVRGPGDFRAYLALFGFQALGTNGAVAVPVLERLMQNGNAVVRVRAMRALACVGKDGLQPLLAAVRNDRYPNRAAAVYWTAELYKNANDARSVIPLLVECLGDPDIQVVRDAVRAMPHVEPSITVPVLIGTVTNTDPRVRYIAIVSLEEFGPTASDATQVLIKALRDADSDVRDAATNALRQIAPDAWKELKGH